MIRISQSQKDYLVEKGYLKLEKGRYPDLFIASVNKNSIGKTYYVPDNYARFLKSKKS